MQPTVSASNPRATYFVFPLRLIARVPDAFPVVFRKESLLGPVLSAVSQRGRLRTRILHCFLHVALQPVLPTWWAQILESYSRNGLYVSRIFAPPLSRLGGLKWTRTIDLALIRRAL